MNEMEKASVAPHIVVEGVSFSYTPAGRQELLALENVNLDVKPREFVAILGPSGCGKSTLLYLIGGFLPLESGDILVNGAPVIGPGADRGVVFQHFALFPWKTVRENVRYGLKLAGYSKPEQDRRALQMIKLVGLNGFEDSFPSHLSGGMKQRAAIARTLAVDPEILLMDEPFGALDAQTRSIMQTELLNIWQSSRKTVVFVTHDVQEAVLLAERVVVMSARPGQIVATVDTRFEKDGGDILKSKIFIDKVDELWHLVRAEWVRAQGAQ